MREELYDPTKGMYVPTSHHLYLDGKLPTVSEQLARLIVITTPVGRLEPPYSLTPW